MRPNLLPPSTMAIRGTGQIMNMIGNVARQVAANSTIEVAGGDLSVEYGSNGIHIAGGMPVYIQRFEITTAWETVNLAGRAGPTQGSFWWCEALPVAFMQAEGGSGQPNFEDWEWTAYGTATTRIFWASSTDAAEAPTASIGSWVWCFFDYESNTWCVLGSQAATVERRDFCLVDDLAVGSENYATCRDIDTDDLFEAHDVHGEFYGTGGVSGGWAEWSNGEWRIRRLTCPDFTSDACGSGQ